MLKDMRRFLWMLCAAASLTLTACGGDDNDEPTPPGGVTPPPASPVDLAGNYWKIIDDISYGGSSENDNSAIIGYTVYFNRNGNIDFLPQDNALDLSRWSLNDDVLTITTAYGSMYQGVYVGTMSISDNTASYTYKMTVNGETSPVRHVMKLQLCDRPSEPVYEYLKGARYKIWYSDLSDLSGTSVIFDDNGNLRLIPQNSNISYARWEVDAYELTITIGIPGYGEDYLTGVIKFSGDEATYTYRYYEGDHFEDGTYEMKLIRD